LCNEEALVADDIGWQSQPHSLEMTIPPLAMVVLKPER